MIGSDGMDRKYVITADTRNKERRKRISSQQWRQRMKPEAYKAENTPRMKN